MTDPNDATALRQLLDLGEAVDAAVEASLQARRSLADTMAALLPLLCDATGARGAFVNTFGEDLALRTFVWPPGFAMPRLDEVLARTDAATRGQCVLEAGADVLVAQHLDVAGEWFGAAGLAVPRASATA